MSTNVAVVDELRLRAAEGRRLNLGRRIIVAGEDLNETERVLLQSVRHLLEDLQKRQDAKLSSATVQNTSVQIESAAVTARLLNQIHDLLY
jgi:hypothetical protein